MSSRAYNCENIRCDHTPGSSACARCGWNPMEADRRRNENVWKEYRTRDGGTVRRLEERDG